MFERSIVSAARWANDEISDLAERESARGRIGAPPRTVVIRFREQEFEKSIRPAIEETFDLFRQVYGTFPPEATDWLRQYCFERIDSVSQRVSRGLRGLHKLSDGARYADEQIGRIVAGLKRDLEIRLAPIEIRASLGALARGEVPSGVPGDRAVDIFISYAGEDREVVARPLADLLISKGYSVWYDRYELKVGMNVYLAIDEGLRDCRFGVVVISPAFFAKSWPKNELSALAVLAAVEGTAKLLPVWHGLDHDEVARLSPFLATLWAVPTGDGLEAVVHELSRSMGPPAAVAGTNHGDNPTTQTA